MQTGVIAAQTPPRETGLMSALDPLDIWANAGAAGFIDGLAARAGARRVLGVAGFYAAAPYVRPPITGLIAALDPLSGVYQALPYSRPPIEGLIAFLDPITNEYGASPP